MENLVTRVLITGVGGFIGSNLAEHLSSKDYEVIGLDRESNVEVEQKINKFIVADLTICDESIITDNKIDYIVPRKNF
jgi:nucleoside-diphosphate-sugar epimerase